MNPSVKHVKQLLNRAFEVRKSDPVLARFMFAEVSELAKASQGNLRKEMEEVLKEFIRLNAAQN